MKDKDYNVGMGAYLIVILLWLQFFNSSGQFYTGTDFIHIIAGYILATKTFLCPAS